MKILKITDKLTGNYRLGKFTNQEAEELMADQKEGFYPTKLFAYSTKGAWKSKLNTLKKLGKAKRREYFRKRRLAKSA